MPIKQSNLELLLMQNIIKLLSCTLLPLMLLFSCKKNIKEPALKKSVIKKVTNNPTSLKQTPQTKKWDSITSKNAIDFLIAYGKEHTATKVQFKTRLGNLTIQLYEDTPLHRASFIFLINAGYFNTTCFHRIVPNFIVQGGNSENQNTLQIKNSYQNYTIPQEFRKHRKHKYGALAAARDWENNISKKSNPFEFYFIQNKKGAHHIDGEHTVFGEIISGFHVMDKISKLKAGRDEWPYKDVFIDAKVIN